jgi:anti-anti-sigma factor
MHIVSRDAWGIHMVHVERLFSIDRSSEKHSDQHTVLRISGDLDIACVPHLTRALDLILPDALQQFVDVDLTGVTFIDCAALGALVQARNHLRDGLRLVGVSEAVVRLLHLTGLTGAFPVTLPRDPDITADVSMTPESVAQLPSQFRATAASSSVCELGP